MKEEFEGYLIICNDKEYRTNTRSYISTTNNIREAKIYETRVSANRGVGAMSSNTRATGVKVKKIKVTIEEIPDDIKPKKNGVII